MRVEWQKSPRILQPTEPRSMSTGQSLAKEIYRYNSLTWRRTPVVKYLSTNRQCTRCGFELTERRSSCPQCQFNPRSKGLRLALVFLLIVVVAISLVVFLPRLGILLVRIAAVSFLLSFILLLVSFLATPYRLGAIFARF